MTEESPALFASIEGALRWAWYFSQMGDSETIKAPSMTRFIKRDQREQIDEGMKVARAPRSYDLDKRPHAYDAAAQAGLIRGYVDRLRIEEQLHLKSKYLMGPDRAKARRGLRDVVMLRMELSWLNRSLAYELIAKYYGKPVRMKTLIKEHQISKHRLAVARRHVEITLDALANRAEHRVYGYLSAAGVVL